MVIHISPVFLELVALGPDVANEPQGCRGQFYWELGVYGFSFERRRPSHYAPPVPSQPSACSCLHATELATTAKQLAPIAPATGQPTTPAVSAPAATCNVRAAAATAPTSEEATHAAKLACSEPITAKCTAATTTPAAATATEAAAAATATATAAAAAGTRPCPVEAYVRSEVREVVRASQKDRFGAVSRKAGGRKIVSNEERRRQEAGTKAGGGSCDRDACTIIKPKQLGWHREAACWMDSPYGPATWTHLLSPQAHSPVDLDSSGGVRLCNSVLPKSEAKMPLNMQTS